MAPGKGIETITVTRPLKLIAFICGLISIILLIVAISTAYWLETDHYRQGLWEDCRWDENSPTVCTGNDYKDWIVACASLSIIAVLVDSGATVLTCFGLCTNNSKSKFKFYRLAMCCMFFSAICLVIALIVFPIMFLQEMERRSGGPHWYFGWSYGIAWGSVIFMVGAAILLLIDRENDEIYYSEKTYYHDSRA